MTSKGVFAIAMFLLLQGPCTGFAADAWSEIPIPPLATDIKDFTILEGQGHQYSYIVDKPYPFDGVRDYYVRNLSKQWALCSSELTGWQDFVDGTSQPNAQIHQRLVHWFDFSRNRLLLLSLRYVSKVSQPYCSGPPDNTRQIVYVVEYKDAKDAAEFLKIKCGK